MIRKALKASYEVVCGFAAALLVFPLAVAYVIIITAVIICVFIAELLVGRDDRGQG